MIEIGIFVIAATAFVIYMALRDHQESKAPLGTIGVTCSRVSSQDWQAILELPYWVFRIVAKADHRLDEEEIGKLGRWLEAGRAHSNSTVSDIIIQSRSRFDSLIEVASDRKRRPWVEIKKSSRLVRRHLQPNDAREYFGALLELANNIVGEPTDQEPRTKELLAVSQLGGVLAIH